MAASDAANGPVKNKAYRVTFDIRKNDGTLISGGSNTTVVSKDGGTFASSSNSPVEVATSSGVWYLELTSTEMNADTVAVKVSNNGTGAVPQVVILYPVSIAEPSAVPTWPTDPMAALAWLIALAKHKTTVTSSTQTLRNSGDSGNISTSSVSDDGTTFTRGAWS